MKKTTFFVLLIFGSLQLFAQDYKTAIGARLGSYGSAGLSLKHFTNETNAFELIGNGRFYSYSRYLELNALFLKHHPLNDIGVEGLSWYTGGGLFVGRYSYDTNYYWGSSSFHDAYTTAGVTAAVGLEYKLENTPLSFSIDYLPSIRFIGGFYLYGNRGSLAVRYTMGRN